MSPSPRASVANASVPGSSGSSGSTPAQNGTVSKEGVAVAKAILAGLHDDQGRQVYISYQPSADFSDAETTYNATSKTWQAAASSHTEGSLVCHLLDHLVQPAPPAEAPPVLALSAPAAGPFAAGPSRAAGGTCAGYHARGPPAHA